MEKTNNLNDYSIDDLLEPVDLSVLDRTPVKVRMLTTTDNPYNPLEKYDEWYLFDVTHNHNCCGLLARFANVSDEMNDSEIEEEIDRAIRHIIAIDPTGMYTSVVGEYTPEYVVKEHF